MFLDGSRLESPRRGYAFPFVPGPAAPARGVIGGGVSPTSLTGWAHTAVPVQAGQTGIRAFCIDQTGMVCAVPSGNESLVMDGRRPVSEMGCEPVT